MNILTRYGALTHCQRITYHTNGHLASCFIDEPAVLHTDFGVFAPAYDFGQPRRKHIPSLKFYDDGTLQAIYLDKLETIRTPYGMFTCEYITFHRNGRLCRLFHLNGKISGYWSEEEELALSTESQLQLPSGPLHAKIMTLHFDALQNLASITLIPNTVITVSTPIGEILTRIGMSFYPNGTLKSLEPAIALQVKTPFGMVDAFDQTALGIIGDCNSLLFTADEKLKGCKTCNTLKITNQTGHTELIEPLEQVSMCDDDIYVKLPNQLEWSTSVLSVTAGDAVQTNRSFPLNQHNIVVV